MAHENPHPTGSKGHHEYVSPSAAKDASQTGGYREKEYEHQEYPKHVLGKVAKDAKEEKEIRDAAAKAAKSAPAQE